MSETTYIKNLGAEYPKLLNQLEKYVQYCLRCLHRANQHPQSNDFCLITFTRKNGQIAEAVCYPATSINETLQTVDNPLFFYGFKADYDFTNLEFPIRITFSDKYEELVK